MIGAAPPAEASALPHARRALVTAGAGASRHKNTSPWAARGI